MNYSKLSNESKLKIKTLKALKESGYNPIPIKEEIRQNLINSLKSGKNVFEGIWGYEETVIPSFEKALLSRHNINLLGLRGQAKTRMARLMIQLLDDYIPVLNGGMLNDDPLLPISYEAKTIIEEKGDDAPIIWWHKSERYTEKLATPDVSVADLIGDVDPIKAASLKLDYSDPRVIHYGLIPRAHRGIFVINELPDLQSRIQVSLFNILQEGDIQIRGFKLRLPLDIQFVFTANPEDYTNRGSIVTPLKDRIDSQIITHYPKTMAAARAITAQEATLSKEQKEMITLNDVSKDLIEFIAFQARESEYVDEKSGVSARLTISAYENMVSSAERRALINKEKETHIRVGDLLGAVPAITGKVELVYEGEQEGAGIVAENLVGKAIRAKFLELFPNPEKYRKSKEDSPYQKITTWFSDGHEVDILFDLSNNAYENTLKQIDGLEELIDKYFSKATTSEKYYLMEFALYGLSEHSLIGKNPLVTGIQFKDLLSGMFSMTDENFDDNIEL